MNYPFIKKSKGKLFVKLNKDLYPKELIQKAAEREPGSVISVGKEKAYHLLELNVDNSGEYLDFLNFLIYLKRSQ